MMDRLTKRDVNGIAYIDHGHCEAAANMQAIQRLAGIEDALERGELVRVPCNPGDSFVAICGWHGQRCVKEVIATDVHYTSRTGQWKITAGDSYYIWGKSAFSTREEAEAALGKEPDDARN